MSNDNVDQLIKKMRDFVDNDEKYDDKIDAKIQKNQNDIRRKDPELWNRYINKKQNEKPMDNITEEQVYGGEHFLKNAMISTILGLIFASIFTFRGDD